MTPRPLITALVLLTVTSAAMGHHSPFLFFDPTSTIEVEGKIIKLQWRNPHVVFQLETTDSSGEAAAWKLETHSVSILRRMNLDRDSVSVGDNVKVAGWPSKRGGHELFITNMLMPDGVEIAFDPGAPPRWADEAKGDKSTWMATADSAAGGGAEGIFHVWSTSLVGGDGNFLYEGYDFPLTAKGQAARSSYDMYSNPILGTCEYKGMPTIMEQPYPMQFAKSHNRILMHMEEGNIVRTFDMTPGASIAGKEPTALGHSIGEWHGDTLVITTTGSSWPYVDMTGVPNSPDTLYVERFTPSDDGKTLDYTLTVTDPDTFTETPTFSKQWLWVPGAVVEPYDCVPENEN